jgi:hypothetical protein
MINNIISQIKNIFTFHNIKDNIKDNNKDTGENNNEDNNTNKNNFSRNMSILQGIYIRDNIKIHNIVNKIFKDKMMMEIEHQFWNLEKYDFFSMSTKETNKINNYISKKIMCLENDKIYFIYLLIYEHVNLLYIDLKNNNNQKYYYIYEPHMPENDDNRYPIPQKIESIFNNNNFTKKNFPDYIIKQDQLPLCYMYTLHFFMNLYHLENTNIKKKYIIKNYDDDNIMEFTEWILDLCYQNNMVNTRDYYLLTNKICQYNLFCEKFNFNKIFLKSCNPKVLISFFTNNEKLRINFSDINSIYLDDIDFYYMKQFINCAENANISLFNKHQIFILSLLLKYYYNLDCSTNILNVAEIDQEIFLEALIESDLLSKHVNYNLFKNILKYVKKNNDKKIFIYRFINNDQDKKKCDNNLLNYINQINNLPDDLDDSHIFIGMRRNREQ